MELRTLPPTGQTEGRGSHQGRLGNSQGPGLSLVPTKTCTLSCQLRGPVTDCLLSLEKADFFCTWMGHQMILGNCLNFSSCDM